MADNATNIKRVAVIGAGVMGGGIAAQMADAGVEVVLLDLVPEGATNRNALAEAAVKTQMEATPPGFVYLGRAGFITCGNLEDDLGKLKACDWIIEAVKEDLRIKQDVYRKIDANRDPGSIVSSNTSTLPLVTLTAGMPESFAHDLMITHFFNPPRFTQLLETVQSDRMRTGAAGAIGRFADLSLGKTVVQCKDTPGFKVQISYQNLKECQVNYYPMDIELLFSTNPFVHDVNDQFAFVRPVKTDAIKFPEKAHDFEFEAPKEFHNSNVMVELVAAGMRKSQPYFANALTVQMIENYGQVKVTSPKTGAPMQKVYVKVYSKMQDGEVQFYKDGYTDLRGRFDYASLSTNEIDNVARFAVLVMSDTDGAIVREAAPPKR